jgi:nucleoside-diphosphate-sugar epimerase
MKVRRQLLVVGAGNVGTRVLQQLRSLPCALRWRATALVRSPASAASAQQAGATVLRADLDDRARLRLALGKKRISAISAVIHLAPPPGTGARDSRTRQLLRAIVQAPRGCFAKALRIVYVSTSGVYGDCGGASVGESRQVMPFNTRARRRVDAERAVQRIARRRGWHATILRAPGIYDATHLPLDRIKAGTPAIIAAQDSYTNHIHADDLAQLCIAALRSQRTARVYNANDDSVIRMGDWFDLLADAFALPRPPRLSRAQVRERVSPMLWSFMRESRRLENSRIKRELRVRLQYPTVHEGVAQALEALRPLQD